MIVTSHLLAAWLPALAFGQADHRVPYLAALAHTPLAFLWAGDLCVTLFFVHSGYVLSNRFLVTGNTADLRRQAVKRAVRLGVPVAAAVVATGLLVNVGAMHNVRAAGISSSPWLASFYASGPRPGLLWSAFGGSLFAGSSWWIGSLWSISVQFFGSLFVFALISVFGHDRRRNLVFAVIIAWAIIAGSPRFGVHLAAFTIGVWFCAARSRPATAESRSATGSRTNLVAVVGVATTVAVYFGSWPEEQDVGPWYSFLASRARFMDSYLRPRAMAHTIAAVAVFWLVQIGRAHV